MRRVLHGRKDITRRLGLAVVGILMWGETAYSSETPADNTQYMETTQPRDTRFITAISRLTACKLTRETDLNLMMPLYPPESRKHHEEGKVIMQFLIDSDFCVRKATILQSSGYYRLDKASLDFAMNLKFAPYMLNNVKSFDDGRPTLAFPMVWKLTKAIPYVPGDRCSGGAACIDDAPPSPKEETTGTPPEPGYIWMPGYYAPVEVDFWCWRLGKG